MERRIKEGVSRKLKTMSSASGERYRSRLLSVGGVLAVRVEGVKAGRESSGMVCGLVAVGFLEFGGVVVVDFPSLVFVNWEIALGVGKKARAAPSKKPTQGSASPVSVEWECKGVRIASLHEANGSFFGLPLERISLTSPPSCLLPFFFHPKQKQKHLEFQPVSRLGSPSSS